MSPRVITALGLGQLVNWGVLYYAFAVLMPSVQADLGAPAWHVTGAFSLGLLVSALAAPTAGCWNDRGHAVRAIASGAFGGAVLLVLWAAFPTLTTLYVVWAGLGVCMATSLYEPAFAVITRTKAAPDVRLRALATVTLFGGLASTVFLPATAGLVAWLGWRGAACALAGGLTLSTLMTVVGVGAASSGENSPGLGSVDEQPTPRRVRALALLFGAASLVSTSFVANLIPTLAERGIDTTTGALIGGLFGVMQLPGRALMATRRVSVPGHLLLSLSFGLQTVGLLCVAAMASPITASLGVAIFAAGSGLTTLARPYLVQCLFPIDQTGLVNGRMARAQQLMRAVGPIAASFAASNSSYSSVLSIAGVGLAALAFTAGNSAAFRSTVSPDEQRAGDAPTRLSLSGGDAAVGTRTHGRPVRMIVHRARLDRE
jgi:MFS family permease